MMLAAGASSRAGRASAAGSAVTFVTRGEEDDFRRIERAAGTRIERRRHDFDRG